MSPKLIDPSCDISSIPARSSEGLTSDRFCIVQVVSHRILSIAHFQFRRCVASSYRGHSHELNDQVPIDVTCTLNESTNNSVKYDITSINSPSMSFLSTRTGVDDGIVFHMYAQYSFWRMFL